MSAAALLGLTVNLLYAVFNAFLGFRYHSYWFLSMSAWYLIVGLLKLFIFRRRKNEENADVLKNTGAGILFLAVVLSGIVCMGIAEQHNPVRELVVMIALAAYTFGYFGLAIYSARKAHKGNKDPEIARRSLALVCAIASMLSLERGMLGTFGDAGDHFTFVMEAASGLVAFLLLLLIGISLLRRKKHAE